MRLGAREVYPPGGDPLRTQFSSELQIAGRWPPAKNLCYSERVIARPNGR